MGKCHPDPLCVRAQRGAVHANRTHCAPVTPHDRTPRAPLPRAASRGLTGCCQAPVGAQKTSGAVVECVRSGASDALWASEPNMGPCARCVHAPRGAEERRHVPCCPPRPRTREVQNFSQVALPPLASHRCACTCMCACPSPPRAPRSRPCHVERDPPRPPAGCSQRQPARTALCPLPPACALAPAATQPAVRQTGLAHGRKVGVDLSCRGGSRRHTQEHARGPICQYEKRRCFIDGHLASRAACAGASRGRHSSIVPSPTTALARSAVDLPSAHVAGGVAPAAPLKLWFALAPLPCRRLAAPPWPRRRTARRRSLTTAACATARWRLARSKRAGSSGSRRTAQRRCEGHSVPASAGVAAAWWHARAGG